MPRTQIWSGRSPSIAFAGEENRSVVGPERAGDHVENRRFAGAVGTDESDDRACFSTSKETFVTARRPRKDLLSLMYIQ